MVTLTAITMAGVSALPASAQDTGSALRASAVAAAAESGEAPNEELAKAAAQESGQPVEALNLRGERRDVVANADGSFTAREYTQPVRTVRDGGWVPVDDALVKQSDGNWAPKAATVGVEFSDGGQGPFAKMSRVGREYALTWPGGALPPPHIEGDTARYEEVLPGVDLAVRADVEGFSHYLVVKTAEAAANPQLESIELGLATKGLTVTETESGALKAVDAAVGGTVFESDSASMWDSSTPTGASTAPAARTALTATMAGPPLDAADGGRKAPLDVDVSKSKLTLKPDLQLLRGKDTHYPVVLDPTPRTTGASAWTSVMSGMPNEQDWKYSGHAGMGKCPADYNPTQCAGIGVRRLLFSFPMSFYSGKKVLSASFSARVGAVYWADARAEPVDLYRIGGQNYTVTSSSNWSNTQSSWSDYLMTVNQKISPTTCSSPANLHFSNGELLTDVQEAAYGNWSTMSLGLRAKDESTYGGWKRICGNSYLSITYNTPPAQVATSLMSSNPGGKCVADQSKAPSVDSLPQLRTEARDADNTSSYTDQVKVQFQVFYKDQGGVERSYFADTLYKSPNPGTVFSHQVVQPPLGAGVGMWEPSTRTFHLRNTPTAGPTDKQWPYPEAGTIPLTGDWDGDGVDTIGMFDPTTRIFHLRDKNDGPERWAIQFGTVGDLPVVGDWDGDGIDTVGVWRPSNHYFYLNNEHTNTTTDLSFVYGGTGMTPIAGDWNGDGYDTIGMYDSSNIMIYLRNSNSAGGNSNEIRYGSAGDKPVVGDWNKDKIDTVGVWRPSTHYFYLNNENTNNVADLSFIFGANGMLPLSGNWSTDSGIPANTTISYQARAFDGDQWGPWSSANGAGRCYLKRDAFTPKAPTVTGDPYKDDEVWRNGVGKPGTFTFTAADTDVVGYRWTVDDETQTPVPTTGGLPKAVTWTPTWQGRHTLSAEAFDAAGRTSARADYQFKVVDDGPVGQWNLGDDKGASQAREETGHMPSATPGPGVTFGAPGPADPPEATPDSKHLDGAAHLDGTANGYLSVRPADLDTDPSKQSAVIDPTQSFSVSAWVKPSSLDRDMTVLSQDSQNDAGFVLGYSASAKGWYFEAPGTDETTTTRWRVVYPVDSTTANKWVHLTASFDAQAASGERLVLWVNHEAKKAARTSTMTAGGDFQMGRVKTGQSGTEAIYGAYFAGDIADVRAFTRTVSQAEVDRFQAYMPQRKAYWQFDAPAAEDDTVPNVQAGGEPKLTLQGSVVHVFEPLDPYQPIAGQGHLELDGVNDWAATSAPVVSEAGSYTVSLRARLTSFDEATKSQTVLSLPGRNTDRLVIRYDAPTMRWQAAVTTSDAAGAPTTVATSTGPADPTQAAGDHLAVVYDAITRQVRLYVNGVSSANDVRLDTSPWESVGGIQLGRSAKTAGGEYFAGALDEVRFYGGALDPKGISLLGGLQADPGI
ncbi:MULTISPECIES: LamG-like jellyroll fold domain-containing protein [unclassified Streptomyces]|uniref:LamG-like jellyroll fold domain-containing protein n=1 Tax=unclassified Streptomyces TaxID=2593676 RepID=UPI0036FE0292